MQPRWVKGLENHRRKIPHPPFPPTHFIDTSVLRANRQVYLQEFSKFTLPVRGVTFEGRQVRPELFYYELDAI